MASGMADSGGDGLLCGIGWRGRNKHLSPRNQTPRIFRRGHNVTMRVHVDSWVRSVVNGKSSR